MRRGSRRERRGAAPAGASVSARPSARAVCCWTATIVQGFPDRAAGKLGHVPVIVLILVSTAAGLAAWRCAGAALRTWWGRAPGAAVAAEVREHTPAGRFVQEPARRRGPHRPRADAGAGGDRARGDRRRHPRGRCPPDRRARPRRLRGGSMGPGERHRDDPSHPPRDLEPGIDTRRPRDRRRDRRDRVGARSQPLHPAVPDRRHAGRLARHEPREGDGRSCPSDDRPARGDARAVLPERAFVDRRRVLRRARSARWAGGATTVRRPSLAGIAVGLAVAVACSRVLLDLHWLSDVVGGLALGWGWFALCAVAFGGWLLRFGAPVEPARSPAARPQAPACAAAGASPRPPRPRSGRSSPRPGGR